MRGITVDLGSGRHVLVTIAGAHVVVSIPRRWELRLTREQAWRLSEALDAIATGAE